MTATEPTVDLEIRRLAGALGAEVRGIDLKEPLSDAGFAAIRAALLEHLVLFFPDQHLTPQQHRDFASRWGEMEIHPYLEKVEGFPEIVVIRGALADMWHTDVTFSERPPVMSILNMVQAAPFGGDTMWSNQYAAYDTLSAGLRATLESLRAVHEGTTLASSAGLTHEAVTSVHPVVITHDRTGRKALFVNGCYTTRFEGWTSEESAPLLQHLFKHASRNEFTFRHRWTVGDMLIWDNRATQHCAVGDAAPGEERTLHRITIAGDVPR